MTFIINFIALICLGFVLLGYGMVAYCLFKSFVRLIHVVMDSEKDKK